MKNRLILLLDKILLLKRGLTVAKIEHHRHRIPWNFLVNLIGGLLAYTYDRKKPTLGLKLSL